LFHYNISVRQAKSLKSADTSAVHEPMPLVSQRKRALDVAGALLALIFLAPVLVLAALAIRLESRGPVLLRQWSRGARGRPFEILKFRTTTTPEYGEANTTLVGDFLRKAGIDEMPQLINVLRGEMSLVGPRPHDRLGALAPMFDVKPGLTGLAQIAGRGGRADVGAMAARLKADVTYIANWSMRTDCKILLLTLVAALCDAPPM
jgi:putative colanic acid biosysnthesis UDP-glucose lipid carrier transferase